MLHFIKVFSLLLIALSFSCKQLKQKPDIEKAITDLTNKFPQLPRGKAKQEDFYRPIRSVTIGDKNIMLKLYSSPDSLDGAQKIILIINEESDIYAIPLFSNLYRDYWRFEFDTIISLVKPTKTTFQNELTNSLEKLALNDTLGTGGIVINELLLSLLQCEKINKGDSAFINIPSLVNYSNLNVEEDNDSCSIRIQKNWQAITKDFHQEDYIPNNNAFWDKKNKRIYKFNFVEFYPRRKTDFTINIYRQDCIFRPIYL
jgi:hypothetical protein